MIGEPFHLGVNYWPRRKAMGWWKDFDRGEVDDEFALIHELGMSLVRIFLLWEDFQPAADLVSPSALADLESVCDVAAEHGLGLDVTFFTGHMSGPNWAPPWLLGGSEQVPGDRQVISGADRAAGSYRNSFSDPEALDAASLLVREVVGRLGDHHAIWAWNLGNEPDLFALPADADAGPAWAERLFSTIATMDDRHHRTVGLHAASLMENNGLRVDRMFTSADLAVMHAYPIYADFASGPLDTDAAPFATALTAAMSGRPALMEEFGAATAPPRHDTMTLEWQALGRTWSQLMLSEEVLADHLSDVLPRLVEVGSIGALLWCFADYHEDLWSSPPCDTKPHERHFGLVRPDGSLKPHAQVVRDFIASGPRVQAPSRRARLQVDGDAFYADPARTLPSLYDAFRSQR